MRSLLVLLALSGCGTTTVVCDIEPFMNPTFANSIPLDCSLGVKLDGTENPASMDAARNCVITNVNQQPPKTNFFLVWTVANTTNNHLRQAITGVVMGGVLVVRQYAYAGDAQGVPGDLNPKVSVQTCNADARSPVYATPNCTVGAGKPCLSCNLPLNGQLLCGG
jgi:hypothetical protein